MPEIIIIRKEQAAEFIAKLYLNVDYADVIFIVENESLPANRNILAISSEYFRGLLYGGFAEAEKKEIELQVKLEPFKAILKYVYTGTFTYDTNDNELMLDVLELANTYDYHYLVLKLAEKLIESINIDNVASILTIAFRYNLENLYKAALGVIDRNAKEFIEHESFLSLSKDLVSEIIKRNEFEVYELDIFNAIIKWSQDKTADDLKFILSHIRFTLMQIDELRENVATTGVLQTSEISDIIKDIKELDCLPYRNGCTHRNQLKVINVKNDEESRYKSAWSDKSVMLKLPTEKIINHILFEAPFFNSTSYYIEVSQDQREWTRILDYRKHLCFGRQQIYFKLCAVRYVYITFDENTSGEFYFHCEHRFFSVPRIIDGFVVLQNQSYAEIEQKENVIVANFSQPYFINYLRIDDNQYDSDDNDSRIDDNQYDSDEPIIQFETSFNGKEFKKFEFQYNSSAKILIFESHVVNAVKITVAHETEIASISGCYYPGSFDYILENPCIVSTPTDTM